MGRPRKQKLDITVKYAIETAKELLTNEMNKMANSQLEDGAALFQVKRSNYRDFIKEETKSQDHIVRVFNAYEKGDITREEWMIYLVAILINYTKSLIISKQRHLSGIDMNDLISNGITAVMVQMDDYDPRQSMPTTYFVKYIDQYTKPGSDTSHTTTYYSGRINNLRKIAVKNGFSGLDDPRLTPEYLATISGEALTTVIEAMKEANIKKVSYEAATENVDLASDFDTPEESLLKKEKQELLLKYVNRLSPLQKFIVYKTTLAEDDERVSFKQMIKILRKPEVMQKYAEELPKKRAIDSNWIESESTKAMNILRQNPYVYEYAKVDIEPCYQLEHHEQATEEDIMRSCLGQDRMECDDVGLI